MPTDGAGASVGFSDVPDDLAGLDGLAGQRRERDAGGKQEREGDSHASGIARRSPGAAQSNGSGSPESMLPSSTVAICRDAVDVSWAILDAQQSDGAMLRRTRM